MSYIKKQNFYFIIFLIFFLNLEKSECDSLSKSPRKNKQKVGVYYGNWHGYGKLDICRIPGEKIDYLFYAFLNPSSGECEFSDPKIDLEKIGPKDGICESSDLQTESDPIRGNLYQLSKLKLRFSHIKIIASIGGWSFSKAFHDFILTDEKRIKLVDSCVNLIKLYSNIFDGLDIDLEYPCLPNDIPCGPKIIPSSDDRGHFASLLQEFRKKTRGKLLFNNCNKFWKNKNRCFGFRKN